MTDRKLTNDGVIKALECFAIDKDFDERQCIGCAFETKGLCCENASEGIAKVALAVVNRQKAKIEALQMDNEQLQSDIVNANMNLEHIQYEYELLKQEKSVVIAEAIKEFADRLIKKCDAPHWCVWMSEIEDLVKEMTEEQK
jgi:hypothetical protein